MRTRTWGGAVLALVLTVAACSPDQPSTTETPASGDGSAPVAEPTDRDPSAVMAAVRRIDFCAVARQVTGAADVSARDPFSCGAAGASVGVVRLGTDERLRFPVRAIGDAKAYVDSSRPDDCVVYFPLSFEFALKVDGAGCEPAVDLALAATPRWDACGALAEAAGEGDRTEAGATIGAACERTEPDLARLEFGFGSPLVGPTRTETVGGVQVEVQENDSTGRTVCWTAWPGAEGLWTAVAADSCALARTLTESVMTVLGSPPPDVAPQEPLLYGPDEPDTPLPGACANLERDVAGDCRPYTDTRVPDANLLEADADTQCAMALDAVTRHVGTRLVPVVVDDGEAASCYFVESERQVQVQFRVASDPVEGVPDVFDARDAEIAAHPGYVEDGQAYRVWVATTDDPRRDGRLSLTIDAGPAARDDQSPAGAAAMAESVIADVLATHFS